MHIDMLRHLSNHSLADCEVVTKIEQAHASGDVGVLYTMFAYRLEARQKTVLPVVQVS